MSVALAAIIAALLLAALLLRMDRVSQAVEMNAFSIDVARALAGAAANPLAPTGASADRPEMDRLLGMLALKAGDKQKAGAFFQSAIEGSADTVPMVRYAQPRDMALATLAYNLYPALPDSPAWLAGAETKSKPEDALKLYRQAAALDPSNYIVWEQTGQLAQTLKHDDIARDAWSRACDLYPAHRNSCIYAARLDYKAENWDRVIYYYTRGLMPSTPTDWVLMIKAAQKLGRTADAAAYLAQAQKAVPADYNALLAKQP